MGNGPGVRVTFTSKAKSVHTPYVCPKGLIYFGTVALQNLFQISHLPAKDYIVFPPTFHFVKVEHHESKRLSFIFE